MDNAAFRPRHTVVPGVSDRIEPTPCRRQTRSRAAALRKNSDPSWGTVLLRKKVIRGLVGAGWICAVRMLGYSGHAGTGAGRWPEIREGCRERPDGGLCTHLAHHSIGDAMKNLLATEYSLTRQRSLWGASRLLVPSSAGDNRPYISNLAEKLAGAHLNAPNPTLDSGPWTHGSIVGGSGNSLGGES